MAVVRGRVPVRASRGPLTAMRGTRRAAAAASVCTAVAVILLGVAALRTPGLGWGGYRSSLGAPGAPARGLYAAGVVTAGIAAGLLAVALREVLAAAMLLGVAAASFAGSAGVPCTPGCPLPVADGFPWNGPVTWVDTVHAAASAGAFVAAAGAMAVLARRPVDRLVRRGSAAGAVLATVVMAVQLVWAVFVHSHGPVTGTTERTAALVVLAWTTGVAVRLWWRPTACRTVGTQEGDAMRLEHRLSVPAGPDETWALLADIRAAESLVPGLRLDRVEPDEATGVLDLDVPGGRLTYHGEAALADRDDTARSLEVEVAGREASDGRTASATLTVAVEPDGAATTVLLRADVDVAGGGPLAAPAVVADVVRRVAHEVAERLAGRLFPDRSADPVHAGVPGGPHRAHGCRHGAVTGDPVAAIDPVEPVDDVAAAPTVPPSVVRPLRRRPVTAAPRGGNWTTYSPLAELPRPAARPPARPPLRLVPPARADRPPVPAWDRRGAFALGVLVLLALLLWLARRLRA